MINKPQNIVWLAKKCRDGQWSIEDAEGNPVLEASEWLSISDDHMARIIASVNAFEQLKAVAESIQKLSDLAHTYDNSNYLAQLRQLSVKAEAALDCAAIAADHTTVLRPINAR